MRKGSIAFGMMWVVLLLSCGSNQNLIQFQSRPVDIDVTSSTVSINGKQVKLAFVLDQFSARISAMRTDLHTRLDLDQNDDPDNSPLAAGQAPISMTLDEGVSPMRVYSADMEGRNKFCVACIDKLFF
ncbi:MAG: hypothetical protein R3A11_02265 [Bdellovibrionota bacterium]